MTATAEEIVNIFKKSMETAKTYIKEMEQLNSLLKKAFDTLLSHTEYVDIYKNDEGKFLLSVDSFSYEITEGEYDLLFPLLYGETK